MIYLDHQATTPLDERVLDAMLPWYRDRVGNPHSATHSAGQAAHDAVEAAREQVAALIGAEPDEIVFTSGATEATNLALRGLLAGAKVHAVTTTIEHSCVRDTFADLLGRGLAVTEVAADADGLVDPVAVGAALTRRTRLVSVMAVNNEVGTVQPLREIAGVCEEAGVVFHTDAAQAVGKIPIDVGNVPIGLMSISGHKLYGPQGIGALYCRRNVFGRLKPVMTGGGQERGLRPGTLPAALCVGMGVACLIARAEMETEARRLTELRAMFLDRLCEAVEGVHLNGSAEQRIPGNLNLLIDNVDAEALLSRLRDDVAMSTGSACSSSAIEPSHVLLAMGLSAEQAQSSIRVGLGRSTTAEQIAEAVRRLAKEIGAVRSAGAVGAARGRQPRMKRAAGR